MGSDHCPVWATLDVPAPQLPQGFLAPALSTSHTYTGADHILHDFAFVIVAALPSEGSLGANFPAEKKDRFSCSEYCQQGPGSVSVVVPRKIKTIKTTNASQNCYSAL